MRRALLLTLIRCLLAHAHRDEVCAEVGEMCRCKVGQSIIYGRSGALKAALERDNKKDAVQHPQL